MKSLPEIFNNRRSLLSRDPIREFFNDFWAPSVSGMDFSPLCDIDETDNQYLVTFDIPGMKKDEIKLDVRGGKITVSGERKSESEVKGKANHQTERYYGSFTRSVQLPQNIKEDQIEAQYADGVLSLTVPKAEVVKSRQIQINDRTKESSKH